MSVQVPDYYDARRDITDLTRIEEFPEAHTEHLKTFEKSGGFNLYYNYLQRPECIQHLQL